MAATESTLGKVMFTVSAIDADWTCSQQLNIKSIIFYPSAVDDILKVQEYIAGTTADSAVWLKSVDGGCVGVLLHNDGVRFKPMIDVSECTFDTAANVKVTFMLGR
jgi:hypothetical protein